MFHKSLLHFHVRKGVYIRVKKTQHTQFYIWIQDWTLSSKEPIFSNYVSYFESDQCWTFTVFFLFCYHSSIYNEDFSNFDINTKWIFEDKILFWDHSCLHTMQGHSSLGIIAAVPIRFRNGIDLHNKLGTHISSHLEIRPTKYHDLIGIIVLIPTYRLFNIID